MAQKKKKSVRVNLISVFKECFKGKTYVEVYEEEDAFPDQEEYFETINLKESDI